MIEFNIIERERRLLSEKFIAPPTTTNKGKASLFYYNFFLLFILATIQPSLLFSSISFFLRMRENEWEKETLVAYSRCDDNNFQWRVIFSFDLTSTGHYSSLHLTLSLCVCVFLITNEQQNDNSVDGLRFFFIIFFSLSWLLIINQLHLTHITTNKRENWYKKFFEISLHLKDMMSEVECLV